MDIRKNVYDDLLKDLNLAPGSVPLLSGELVSAGQNGAGASMIRSSANSLKLYLLHTSFPPPVVKVCLTGCISAWLAIVNWVSGMPKKCLPCWGIRFQKQNNQSTNKR